MAYTASLIPRTLGHRHDALPRAPTAANLASLPPFTVPSTRATVNTPPSTTKRCMPDDEGTASTSDARPTNRRKLNGHDPEASPPTPHSQDAHAPYQQPTPPETAPSPSPKTPPLRPQASSPPPPPPPPAQPQRFEAELRRAAIEWMTAEYAATPNGMSISPPAWFRRKPGNIRPVAWMKDWATGAVRPRCLRDDLVDGWSEARRADWVRSQSPESGSESDEDDEDEEDDEEADEDEKRGLGFEASPVVARTLGPMVSRGCRIFSAGMGF
ncbi:hypothetical protein B0T22DRAFT_444726 [Podospora appendiculata]|uniref:Uncharacterized protein n=1 Tax=Podospora appendiculata TaxID=314037 RepID=A0AAE1C884_9PEZI|nr:hypothetical protein B0T22DRAFT_444726 [Podospora appendiculata]